MRARTVGEWAGESLAELDMDPEDDAAYEAWCREYECPEHGQVEVIDSDEMPSMTGHGWDTTLVLSCGGRVYDGPYTDGTVHHPKEA